MKNERKILRELILEKMYEPGFFFGSEYNASEYVGMKQGTDGNIVVIGGNGSGKSSAIAMPTLETWTGAICATDVKGELSEHYALLYENNIVNRPFIVFDPTDPESPSFDPFAWLAQGEDCNLLHNVWELALAIIPVNPNAIQPFWIQTEQAILAAALLYYYKVGLGFSQAVGAIMGTSLSELCKKLSSSVDFRVRVLLGSTSAMKDETKASIDRGLRNHLMQFAADIYISHAFRGEREDAKCFDWSDLEENNIFLRIPANRIEQWGGAINLMYSQLIRHLERRPDKHSTAGRHNVQTLLLMDEVARFGKLELLIPAMTTLRSKNVNLCLLIQSLGQLDKLYGKSDRQVILDNCQYQVILGANDAETQEYISRAAGTRKQVRISLSEHFHEYQEEGSYSRQLSQTWDRFIQPHELSMMEDVLLLTPCCHARVKKYVPYKAGRLVAVVSATQNCVLSRGAAQTFGKPDFRNDGAEMLDVSERAEAAGRKIEQAEQTRRDAVSTAKKVYDRRCYILGELVIKYFPELSAIIPGYTDVENKEQFRLVDRFMFCLASDGHRLEELKYRGSSLYSDDVEVSKKRKRLTKEEEYQNRKRRYILGDLICKYFPDVCEIEPGTKAENELRFKDVEAVLRALVRERGLFDDLHNQAANIA